MIQNFILGYKTPETNELTQPNNMLEAEYEYEEWCIVPAETLEEAIIKYEETFDRLKKEGRIVGPFAFINKKGE
jgi:hypothetical protein